MVEVEGARVRSSPWDLRLFGAGALSFLVALTSSIALDNLHRSSTVSNVLAVVALLAAVGSVLALLRPAMRKAEPVMVRADERGLTIGDQLVSREAVRRAYVIPQTSKNP